MGSLNRLGFSVKTLALLSGGIVLLILMVALGILPDIQRTGYLATEADRLETRIEEQKILYPLYAGLVHRLNQEKGFEEMIREIEPDYRSLSVDNSAGVLTDLAVSAGMNNTSFNPVPESLTGKSPLFLVEGSFRGDYEDFRAFLLKLSAWDNFHRLEHMEVNSGSDGLEYFVRIWMYIS